MARLSPSIRNKNTNTTLDNTSTNRTLDKTNTNTFTNGEWSDLAAAPQQWQGSHLPQEKIQIQHWTTQVQIQHWTKQIQIQVQMGNGVTWQQHHNNGNGSHLPREIKNK